jgi:hypothetical protein
MRMALFDNNSCLFADEIVQWLLNKAPCWISAQRGHASTEETDRRIFSVLSATAGARVMSTDNPFMRGFLIWLEVVTG